MKNNHQISTQANISKGEQITMAFMEENLFNLTTENEDKIVEYPEKTPKKRGRKSKAELALIAEQNIQAKKDGSRIVLGVEEIETLANEIKTEFNITPENPPATTPKAEIFQKKRGRKKGSKKNKKESEINVRHTIKKSVVDRVKEFVQICPKVPNNFIYYIGLPNENEREVFGLDKNLTFAKLVIWDGEANFAFTIGDIEVFEVENIIPNESKLVKDDQEWILHQYKSKPNFLDIAEMQCKNLGKDVDVRSNLLVMKNIHNDIFKNHTSMYETLVEYQNLLNLVLAENIETYNQSRQDFQECQIAVEKIKQFLATLKE